jgi:DNA gyrase subunit A
MGVFDLEMAEDDTPAALAMADESETVLVFTSGGRTYRVPVAALPEAPVRARGQSLRELVNLSPHEHVVAALPAVGPVSRSESVALVSQRGWVRRIRASFFGPSLIQGTIFHDVKEGGPLVGAAWTGGKGDLFIMTRDGKAIRFAESQVPSRGCLGIRLDAADIAVGIAGATADGGVFVVGQDGAGTIRLMSGFAANKAPGAGGKLAMKSDQVVGAVAAAGENDLMLISRLGKLIRFSAADIPPKEGVVQGVACMSLRADEVAAVLALDL